MTEPTNDTVETVGIMLVSAVWGFIQYLNNNELLHGLAIAALFGVVGGMFKGVGHYIWSKLSKRYKWDHHDSPKKD